jgi:UDP-N-acetylglucosamine--N-acetylmuramyl-(pentapeptide) pyrophosphoryl-undecaprenol N-acetylglucosamine transferase
MQLKKDKKIMLTGGHAATPAIAVVEEIRSRHEGIELSWVGSKHAVPGSSVYTIEYKILPKLGVKFYPIAMGKLQTKFTRFTIPLFLNIPISFFQAFFILIKVRPSVILSFGGFSSFPVIFWGFVFGIPLIVHEQTTAAGRASIASSLFASKVAVARVESHVYFPKRKIIFTGNPVMRNVLNVKPKLESGKPPVLLVMGGSRGSQFINEEVVKIKDFLVNRFRVIHISGESNYKLLGALDSERYKVVPFVDPEDMGKYYEQSDIIISRSGANSVSEILCVRRPAILIPLPRTFAGEQVKNAEFAEKFGLAKMMLESEVSPSTLSGELSKLAANWKTIVRRARDRENPDLHAAQKLVDILESYLR